MTELAQHPAVQALAWALVHFLWQGALIAAAAALLMRVSSSASIRYATGAGALVVMLLAPIATFEAIQAPGKAAPARQSGLLEAGPSDPSLLPTAPNAAAVSNPTAATDPWPLVGVIAWLVGMLLLSVRLAGGWVVARRMATRAVRPAAAQIQALASDVAARLELRRAVEVFESSAIAVPVLVGWVRPAVVFPVAALAGLSPAQIEALLAHELAHVRRHDYLVNLLQSFAEVVLFYHPAMWWLSRRVRAERELCCDDVAVGVCDRLVYATALTDLAAMMSPRVALAATGGDLLGRVRRILQREEPSMTGKMRSLAAAMVFVAMCVALPAMVASVRPAASPATFDQPSVQATETSSAELPESPALIDDTAQASQEASARLAALIDELAALEVAALQDRTREAQQASEREVEALRKRIEDEERRNQLEIARSQLARARRMFETGMMSPSDLARAELEVARLEAGGDEKKVRAIEIDAARRQLAEAKRRVEIGVLPPRELMQLEADLARLQAGNDVNKLFAVEVEAARRDYEAKNTLFEKGLIAERQLRESEALINRLEQSRRATDRERVVDEGQRAEVEKLVRELRERSGQSDAQKKEIERLLELRERDLARTTERRRDELASLLAQNERRKVETDRDRQRVMEEVTARMRNLEERLSGVAERRERLMGEARPEAYEQVAPRAIAAGDFLSIVISGESELPTIYRIDSSGAVRIPLLGTFKVVGQTPDQVRQAIGRKLSESRLGSTDSVRVAIRRMRATR